MSGINYNSQQKISLTESSSNSAFGFWLLYIMGLIIVAQVLRLIILKYNAPTFLNDKFVFSIDIPTQIIYLLYTIVIILLITYLLKYRLLLPVRYRVGLLLILAGGISNLIERFSFGYVVDYIFIFTGVLNIADLYILTGVLLAVLQVRKKS